MSIEEKMRAMNVGDYLDINVNAGVSVVRTLAGWVWMSDWGEAGGTAIYERDPEIPENRSVEICGESAVRTY